LDNLADFIGIFTTGLVYAEESKTPTMTPPDKIAEATAGCESQAIEMTQVILGRRPGPAQLWERERL
jgi:hypothetical protein